MCNIYFQSFSLYEVKIYSSREFERKVTNNSEEKIEAYLNLCANIQPWFYRQFIMSNQNLVY